MIVGLTGNYFVGDYHEPVATQASHVSLFVPFSHQVYFFHDISLISSSITAGTCRFVDATGCTISSQMGVTIIPFKKVGLF